jgi:hypothetical protein
MAGVEAWYCLSDLTVPPGLLHRMYLAGLAPAFIFIPLAVVVLWKVKKPIPIRPVHRLGAAPPACFPGRSYWNSASWVCSAGKGTNCAMKARTSCLERMNPRHLGMHLDVPATYQIKLRGRLGMEWSTCFDNLEWSVDEADNGQAITTLCGKVTDQAALHGLLNRIRDLAMVLLLVEWLSD